VLVVLVLALAVGCASSSAEQVVDPNDTASNTVQGGVDVVAAGFTACAVIEPCANLFRSRSSPPAAPAPPPINCVPAPPSFGPGVMLCEAPKPVASLTPSTPSAP
jgi:hypothetical protein